MRTHATGVFDLSSPGGQRFSILQKFGVEEAGITELVSGGVKNAMLVPIGQLVEKPKGMGGPLLLIGYRPRLQVLQNCHSLGVHAPDSVTPGVSILSLTEEDRELDPVLSGFGVRALGRREVDELPGEMVERRTSVVQAVPDEDSKIIRGAWDVKSLEGVPPALGVFFRDEFVRYVFVEPLQSLIKRSQVFLAPVNLQLNPAEPAIPSSGTHALTSP